MDPLLQWLWALGLIVLCLALSLLQGLALEGQILLAAGRSLLQLAVLGYGLAAVLAVSSPIGLGLLLLALGAIALEFTRRRISLKLPQLWTSLALPVAVAVVTVVSYALLLVVRPEGPWYAPRYALPLAAMVLASCTQAAAIAGERLVTQLNASRGEIETHLSLGASPQQALRPAQVAARRAAILPHLGTILVVGLGSLPTWTAGQLLGGMPPLEAVAYEMVLLFMQLTAMLITVGWVTQNIARQFFQGEEFITW